MPLLHEIAKVLTEPSLAFIYYENVINYLDLLELLVIFH